MACDPVDVISSTELSNLKLDIATIDDVIESSLDTTTTKDGKVINTLLGQLKLLGYQAPIAYAGSIVFGTSDNTKTVEEASVVYAPLPSALPFTTSGTFIGDDDARFFVVQGVTPDTFGDLGVRQFATRTAAIAANSQLSIGDIVQTSGLSSVGDGAAGLYDVVASGTGTDDGGKYIDSITPLAYQLRLNSSVINGLHWGVKGGGATNNSVTLKAAIDYAYTLVQTDVGLPGGVSVDAVPEVWLPTDEYLINTAMSIGSNSALALGSDVKASFTGSGASPANGFITGTACRNLTVRNMNFENFTTVFAVSSSNADSSEYIFDHCGAGDVDIFIDSNSHVTSRSTICTFNDCKFIAGITQLTVVYFDQLNFKNCWFQTDNAQRNYIWANSNINVDGCMFVPGGLGQTSRTWFYWTNDDGAAGVTAEQTRNINISNSRFSNEGGVPTGIVADFPVKDSTSSTPGILIENCNINGFRTTAGDYDIGNSESGFIYLLQYPASINVKACTFYSFGDTGGKLVAKRDSLLVSAAPDQFNIWLDESSYSGIQRTIGANSGYSMGSLATFTNNPDSFVYKDILENGHLNVNDAVNGYVTIVDFNSIVGQTVTLTGAGITGSPVTYTEGVDFVDTTGNDETATSLAAAITATTGVSATASGAVVTIVPDGDRNGYLTIVDYTSIAGNTVTLTGTGITGSPVTYTEGVDFFDTTGNDETATSLAAAITSTAGVSASASGAVVTITPDNGSAITDLTSNAGADITVQKAYVITDLTTNAGADITVQNPYGIVKSTFNVTTNYSTFNHLPVSFWLILSGLADATRARTQEAGTSIYACTLNGIVSSGNKSRLSSTLVHEDASGYGTNSSTSLLSLHFGTAETGISTATVATNFDVTVTWGSGADGGIGTGTARIIPMMQFHNRNSGQPF